MSIGRLLGERVDGVLQSVRIRALRDPDSERRFAALAPRYADLVALAGEGSASRSDGGSAYAWGAWAQEIHESFRPGLPPAFLRHPRIRDTMVYGVASGVSERVSAVRDAFGPQVASRLLREDAIGRPRIVESVFHTSAHRAHHAYHLANYATRVSRAPWECASFVEWGGGYGNMARILRRLAPGATYCILDLPPILAIQYVFLASLEGEEACRIVTARDPGIVPGKINLVDSALVLRGDVRPAAEMFLSTWAATESPPAAQAFIAEQRFFGAPRLLLAYLKDESNRLVDALVGAGCARQPVRALAHDRLGDQHEYAFR